MVQARPPRRYTTLFTRASHLYQYQAFLPHTYTREALIDGAVDPYGIATTTYGAPAAGLPCGMSEQPSPGADPAQNPTLVYRLTLLVPPDDPLKPGDRITMVTDAVSGQVVDAGPTYVTWVRSIHAWGPVLLNLALLSREEGQA